MKKLLFTFFTLLYFTGISQTIVFHENFELPSLADSVTMDSVGFAVNQWAISNTLATQGLRSDSCTVSQNDISILTTDAFSTIGYSNVILKFSQICKIDFYNAAEIYVSGNNGVNWTKLIGANYLGNGIFAAIGNKFTSTSYGIDWHASNNNAIPVNSWWKYEQFDISSIVGNCSQVKIKFQLSDALNVGSLGNYGWLLDDIKVIGVFSELIPPVISLNQPIIIDTAYYKGPFDIYATITDASGIDTAMLVYTYNNGLPDTVGMLNTTGNIFYGRIDTLTGPFNLLDTFCYYVYATDGSAAHNQSLEPFFGCNQFVIYTSPPPTGCITPITTFPFFETFETFPIGGTSCTSVCGTANGWVNETSDDADWGARLGTTASSNTGPIGDHTNGADKYMYTEASSCYSKTAILTTPCLDLTVMSAPTLEFYYHMYGQTMGSVHIDIWYGGQWLLDIWTISGQQQNNSSALWTKAIVNLNPYKNVAKIRFRGITGSYFESDMAIDDVKIFEPIVNDAGVLSIDKPVSPVVKFNQAIKVTFKNFGLVNLTKVKVGWSVNGVTQPVFNWSGILIPGAVADSVQIGTFNFQGGASVIKAWTYNPNDAVDGWNINDTAMSSIISCVGNMHGTYNIGGSNPDFSTFNDALFALNYCGIDSHVVFNVYPGIYYEHLEITPIPGASASNTITFNGYGNDSTAVVLCYNTNPTNPFVVKFDSADYITFRCLTIKSNPTQEGSVLYFTGGSCYNTIENNVIEWGYASIYNTYCIRSNRDIDSYNVFKNNHFKNGYIAIEMKGYSPTLMEKGNIFENNIIEGFDIGGLYLMWQDSVIISGNKIENNGATSSSVSVSACYINQCDHIAVIKNKINLNGTSAFIGLHLVKVKGSSTNRSLIANNFISISGTSTKKWKGITLELSHYIDIYYNSFNLTGASSINSSAFYQASGNTKNILNNIFVNTSGGYAAYYDNPGVLSTVDYNNYYTTGTNFVYWSGNKTTLLELQSASGKNLHSINTNPPFLTFTDLHLTSIVLSGLAIPLIAVTDDIDGDTRSFSPTIGADELPLFSFDAGITEIISPYSPIYENFQQSVIVRIFNYSNDTLTNIPVKYSVNSAPAISETYLGQLLPGNFVDYTFNTLLTVPLGNFNICAYTALNQDGCNNNDTMCISLWGEHICTPFYFDDFDGNGPNDFINSNPTRWELGIPLASIINSPHSQPNVWATYLNGYYSPNMDDDLYTPYFNFSNASGLTMRFFHWYETESGFDNCVIQYTENGGITWQNLGCVGDTNGVNWYNAKVNGISFWTGLNNGWTYSSYKLSQFDNSMLPIQFKFKFSSNSTFSYFYGWAIDDFEITAKKIDIDAGVDEIIYPDTASVGGSTVVVKVAVKNFGKDTLYSIPLSYRQVFGIPVNETWTGILLPDDTVHHSFSVSYIANASFKLYSWTSLPGDIYKFNDTTIVLCQIVGMDEMKKEFYLKQNKPNPTNEKTIIDFTLPNSGKINFVIVDVFGRKIYSESKYYPIGDNQIEINVSNYSAGVYYYSIEFENRRLVRKMVIY